MNHDSVRSPCLGCRVFNFVNGDARVCGAAKEGLAPCLLSLRGQTVCSHAVQSRGLGYQKALSFRESA